MGKMQVRLGNSERLDLKLWSTLGLASWVAQTIKNLPAVWETWV